MKKSIPAVLCITYVFSVSLILILGAGGRESIGGFCTLYARDTEVLEQAENILMENGVTGIVSARTQREFFPGFLQEHEYFKAAMNWFSSESGYFLYYPGNVPAGDYLAGLEGISLTKIRESGFFVFFFAAALLTLCIFFTPFKIRFLVSAFPGIAAFYSFHNGGVFFLASAMLGLLTGVHRILYNEGFEFQAKHAVKRILSVIWNDLFLFLIIFICPLWNFVNILPVLLSLAGMVSGEFFFNGLNRKNRKKGSVFSNFKRIKPLTTMEISKKAFPIGFRSFFCAFVLAGSIVFVFFCKPVIQVFPGQAVIRVSDCNLDLEGIKAFVTGRNSDKLVYSDIPAYLNFCWEIESYPFTPVSEDSMLKWAVAPDKVPDSLYFNRYKEDDSGKILSYSEKVLVFDEDFIERCLQNLPPLEKMLASYGKIAYGTENPAETAVSGQMANSGFYLFFVYAVSILFVILLFLPWKFIYNRGAGAGVFC